jgi:hypothetical protein
VRHLAPQQGLNSFLLSTFGAACELRIAWRPLVFFGDSNEEIWPSRAARTFELGLKCNMNGAIVAKPFERPWVSIKPAPLVSSTTIVSPLAMTIAESLQVWEFYGWWPHLQRSTMRFIGFGAVTGSTEPPLASY